MHQVGSRTPKWLPFFVSMLLGASALVAVQQGPASAVGTTITVTTTADDGVGSLRHAIMSAELTADDDTIVFDPGVFAPSASHTITLVTALPTITNPLTITGPGQDVLTISGDDSVRIFTVDGPSVAPGVRVEISDLTLTRGRATLLGGAVNLQDSQTTMRRVRITASQGIEGGGIYSGRSGLTVEDSLIDDNTATYVGGGIRSDYSSPGGDLMSVLRVVNSTIRGNSAPDGGGIYAARPMELIDDTITGNTATTGIGGGVWVGYAYDDSIVSTVISGNTAVSGGGIGLHPLGQKGRITISDSTISDNIATSGDGSGGISAGNMLLRLLDSTVSNGAQGDCVRTWVPGGIWLIYTVAVEVARTTMGESGCTQLDRGTVVTSYSATTAGARGVAVSAGDPPFLVDDTITLCNPSSCSTTGRIIARVTDVSLVDDTFAFVPVTNVTTAFSTTGRIATAWVSLPKIASLSTGTGWEGDLITLTGAGFGDPAAGPSVSVTVGGVAASSVTHVDDTTITFIAPAGAIGPANVAVGSNANTAAVEWGTLASAFTYAVPAPVPAPPAPAPTPSPAPVYSPSAPQDAQASAGDGSATVAWSAPVASGSFRISHYQVASSPTRGSCLTSSLSCEIKGLINGTAYTFEVRALNGAGWGPWSVPSHAVTPGATQQPPESDDPSIIIKGTRGEVAGKTGVVVSGASTGISGGQVLRPWIRFPGQSSYFEGSASVLVDAEGAFTWSRSTGKRIYVYFVTEDGALKSNRVVIDR